MEADHGQLGHPGGRFAGHRDRHWPHNHRADRRRPVHVAGPRHQRRRRRAGLRRGCGDTGRRSGRTPEPENNAPTGLPTISGTPQVGKTLTASTSAINDQDGLQNVSYNHQWLADGSNIAGATDSTLLLTSSHQGKTITVQVSFSDDAGNTESLASVATLAVAGKPAEPLTATFINVPATHNGGNFTFDLDFSVNVKSGYKNLRDYAFTVIGGEVDKAQRRTQGSNQYWTITIDPDGNGDVTVTLPATTDCNATGAICDYDSNMLSNSPSFTVQGT